MVTARRSGALAEAAPARAHTDGASISRARFAPADADARGIAQEDGSGPRPPGCGASTRLPTSPASRQRSAAQECIDAWSDHASSYWLRWTDDSSNTHAYHGADLPLGTYPLDAPSTLRQHARIRPALTRLGAGGGEMGAGHPPSEPLDRAATAEDVSSVGKPGSLVAV